MAKTRKSAIPVRGSKPKAQKGHKAPMAEKTALQELFKQGEPARTEQAAREMIRRYPQEGFGWKVLGVVLQQQGKLIHAVEALARAVALDPEDAEAQCNLGSAQRLAGQNKEAEASFRAAISLNPNYFVALNNLGGLLKEHGRFIEAEQFTRRALAIKPDYANAHMNLGALLKDVGRLTEAEKATRKALELAPDYAEAHMNLGAILQDLGRLKEAQECTQKALEFQPANASAWINLGIIHKDLNQFSCAIKAAQRALEIKPDFAMAWSHLAVFLRELGENSESNEAVRRAIELAPENAAYRLRYAVNSLPIAPATQDEAWKACAEFGERVKDLGAWIKANPSRREKFAREVGIVQPFYLAYRPGNHRDVLSAYGDLLTDAFAQYGKAQQITPSSRSKIRLLIVTGHIRRHSVWDILLKGIVRHLDRTQFELFFYHLGKRGDEETVWAQAQADGWRDMSTAQGNDGWLAAVKQDQPDIIYYPEIGMDPTTVFLAAHRLAPVQVVGWGHPITSGLATMDGYLSGALLEGPDASSHYREELILLPGTGCCTEVIDIEPEASPELMAKLADMPRPRFVIPQRHFKFDPADDGLYAEIAARVGECTFLFPESNKAGWALQRVLARIGQTFRAKGLDPERYLKVIPWLDRGKFYTLLDACDVFLDCPSFSGYTTAWQAAHRGLPIVTLEGETLRQRLAAGLLRQIGQTDTIAQDRPAYVEIAASLAKEARDGTRFAQRRTALKAAAGQADHRIEVVRAFEESLIHQLATRQALPQGFGGGVAQNEEHNVAEPAFDYPWQQLDADLHFHSLKHDYAPVGLLQMVSTPPREVLDVGCFCGGSGRWLKKQFPTARVTGIEMLEKAAAVAREAYDEVRVGKFEDIDLKPWQGKFDAIIAADVLEHMYNPWSVMQKLSPLLAPGGAIYISLPNIRNLNILMGLAGGEWRYAGAGILDITHIRFFTKKQILEMLQQTGWQAHEVKINPDPRLTPNFKDKDLNTVKTINAGKLKLENLTKDDVLELLALQFFIRATPATTSGVPA